MEGLYIMKYFVYKGHEAPTLFAFHKTMKIWFQKAFGDDSGTGLLLKYITVELLCSFMVLFLLS